MQPIPGLEIWPGHIIRIIPHHGLCCASIWPHMAASCNMTISGRLLEESHYLSTSRRQLSYPSTVPVKNERYYFPGLVCMSLLLFHDDHDYFKVMFIPRWCHLMNVCFVAAGDGHDRGDARGLDWAGRHIQSRVNKVSDSDNIGAFYDHRGPCWHLTLSDASHFTPITITCQAQGHCHDD